jgi:hypothetical protein
MRDEDERDSYVGWNIVSISAMKDPRRRKLDGKTFKRLRFNMQMGWNGTSRRSKNMRGKRKHALHR